MHVESQVGAHYTTTSTRRAIQAWVILASILRSDCHVMIRIYTVTRGFIWPQTRADELASTLKQAGSPWLFKPFPAKNRKKSVPQFPSTKTNTSISIVQRHTQMSLSAYRIGSQSTTPPQPRQPGQPAWWFRVLLTPMQVAQAKLSIIGVQLYAQSWAGLLV